MHVYRDGDIYKGMRVTGPTHNFLALEFSTSTHQMPSVDLLSPPSGPQQRTAPPEDAVLQAVLRGISNANEAHGARLHLKRLQFVSTDSNTLSAYEILANAIANAALADHLRSES